MEWQKTTWGEIRDGENWTWANDGHPDNQPIFISLYTKGKDDRPDKLAPDDPVYRLVSHEREALERIVALYHNCRNESYYTELLDEIAKNFGQAAYTSDDGSIQQDPLRAKMPELVATLRSRLDALVTAGEKVVKDSVGSLAQVGPMDFEPVQAVNIKTFQDFSAAVTQAKGEK